MTMLTFETSADEKLSLCNVLVFRLWLVPKAKLLAMKLTSFDGYR